jgi:hypothetical protein
VTQIVDPNSGDTRERRIDVLSQGTDSLIDLDSLINFIDRFGTSSSGDSIWSTITATSGGNIVFPNLIVVRGVNISILSSAIAPQSNSSKDAALAGIQNAFLLYGPLPLEVNPESNQEVEVTEYFGSSLVEQSEQKAQGDGPTILFTDSSSVFWVGGSGVWNDPSNWNSGRVPGSLDSVVINSDVGITVTIANNVRILSLHSNASMIVSGGSLTVTRQSLVSGTLTIMPGASLIADGSLAVFEGAGGTNINGANLSASRGGKLLLPNALSVFAWKYRYQPAEVLERYWNWKRIGFE